MKKYTFIFLTLFICFGAFAQQGINYKAAIRDGDGNLLINQEITVRFTIQQGVQFQDVYQETFNAVSTDEHGLISLVIGTGTPQLGVFREVDWGSDTHFLNVQISGIPNTIGFVNLGTTAFSAVPYAYHASNGGGLVPLDEGNGQGWRLYGRDEDNYDNVGLNALDFSLGTSGLSGAIAENAIAFGDRTKAGAYNSFVIGRKNVGNGSPTQWISIDPIFEIGIGGDDAFSLPHNAVTVLKNGNVGIGESNPTRMLHVLRTVSGPLVRFESQGLIQTQDLLDLSVAANTVDNAQFIEMSRGNTTVAAINTDGAAKFKSIEFEDGTVQTTAAVDNGGNNNNDSGPVAYGNISASGLVNSSSGNIGVTFNQTGNASEGYYNINIVDSSFSNTDTLMVFFNQRFMQVDIDDTNGDIQLSFTAVDNNGIEIPFVQTPFQFVLYN